MHRLRSALKEGARAGAIAGLLSGLPSTLHATLTGRDPLAASIAAGSLLLPRERRRGRLLMAAVPVHVALSLGWGVALAATLPSSAKTAWGAAAGVGIAALDLGLVGRHFPLVRALPLAPQVADHLVFGALAGALLSRSS